uniref:Interleukin-17 receptor A-like n=1 Tax=Phallusia mammillata TaxID=59560 RepID=A0A6F9DFM1_9ASCI|nr:interleukin-17 receptor A-like [Phallusia mammillata]
MTVYIVFVDDHPKHKDIILKFASFLQCDLGFHVLLELWEQDAIYKDSLTWMENSLNKSDKIIVVWSPGAKRRWESQNKVDQTDMFCPVVKKIKGDLLMKRNTGKYFCAFFDYCSDTDVPKAFSELSFCNFKLMNQFEDLYFRLTTLEKFQPGKVIHQNKVTTKSCFTHQENKFGKVLSDAVVEMCDFVQSNPDWSENKEKQLDISITEANKIDDGPSLVNTINLPPLPSLKVEAKSVKHNETSTANSQIPPPQLNEPVILDDSIIMPLEISVLTDNISFATESLPSRQPTEHEEAKIVLNPNSEEQKPVSDNFKDSGIGSPEPNPLFHVSAFSFAESDIADNAAAYRPVCIEPIDMKNDPWNSLAQINNVSV